ncbi:unnamed protein product [Phytophthora fragariaefolia]|uniref:Unnamed protein product n=1 Tax=Phytophthora fragariaefolia TaxID=1490495 RepID=A0A9W6XH50_9STRA|nr:unnamed protein product [Phytophthora fragariaefolia]
MTDDERAPVVAAVLAISSNGVPTKGAFVEVATKFPFTEITVRRVWSFVERRPAQRSSCNRPAGTMEKHDVSVGKDAYRLMLIQHVLSVICARMPLPPHDGSITFQQDNAPPHIAPTNPQFYQAVLNSGRDVALRFQPPNTPDLNYCGLGCRFSLLFVESLVVVLEQGELEEYPEDHFYCVQEIAWMDCTTWKFYLEKLLKFEIDAPGVLLLDNFECHVSEEGQRVVADEANATVVPLPPNSTALCQLLDMGIIGSLTLSRTLVIALDLYGMQI